MLKDTHTAHVYIIILLLKFNIAKDLIETIPCIKDKIENFK